MGAKRPVGHASQAGPVPAVPWGQRSAALASEAPYRCRNCGECALFDAFATCRKKRAVKACPGRTTVPSTPMLRLCWPSVMTWAWRPGTVPLTTVLPNKAGSNDSSITISLRPAGLLFSHFTLYGSEERLNLPLSDSSSAAFFLVILAGLVWLNSQGRHGCAREWL